MEKMELKVRQTNGVIEINYDELNDYVDGVIAEYKGAKFGENDIQLAKDVVAYLRKVAKDLDSRRKEVKNAWMVPYTKFEQQIKTLLEKFDEAINPINEQLDEYEKNRKAEKLEKCKELYAEIVGEEIRPYLPWGEVFDERWPNKTTTIKSIRESLEAKATATYNDLSVLMASTSDVKEKALKIYQSTRQLSDAIKCINDYEAEKARILEEERLRKEREEEEKRKREEEERRRAEEAERRRKEEEERKAEEDRKKEMAAAIERAKAEERARIAKEQSEGFSVADVAEDEDEGFSVTDAEPTEALDDGLPFVQPTTKTVFYKVVASEEELEEVEKVLNSFGIFYERRDA